MERRCGIAASSLDRENLLAAVGLPDDQLSKVLARGDHRDALRKMFDQYAQNADIGQLEQAMDRLTFSVIKESRNDSFGIGPIVYYLLRRENEAKALRVLFAQKRAGMLSSLVSQYAAAPRGRAAGADAPVAASAGRGWLCAQ